MIDLNSYFQKAVFYNTYVEKGEKEVREDAPLAAYSKLNLQRMKRIEKQFQLNEEQQKELQNIAPNFYLLVISEAWCGDAAHVLPIIKKIADELKVEMRVISRDAHIELMETYHTLGSHAIPIVIGIDSNTHKELFRWGPRTEKGFQLLAKHRTQPEKISKEAFYESLQSYYNQNKGKDISNEIIEKIKSI